MLLQVEHTSIMEIYHFYEMMSCKNSFMSARRPYKEISTGT